MPTRPDHRRLALERYGPLCAVCGFGIASVLEVAHLDGNHHNNRIANLAVLCPTCHRMHDLDLFTRDIVVALRDRPKLANWRKLMKDAGARAAETRMRRVSARKRAGPKAAATRKRRAAARKAAATRRAARKGES